MRVLGRFPQQAPLEIDGEILRFAALQLGADAETIYAYARRQQTVSEHQQRIGEYLRLGAFDNAVGERLARFLEDEALRLDRTASLLVVLQYMSEPKLRAKVRRGLLKVEQLHALARAVYYGQRGRISAREVPPRPGRSRPSPIPIPGSQSRPKRQPSGPARSLNPVTRPPRPRMAPWPTSSSASGSTQT